MYPQDARFNRGYWAKVERFVRSLTGQFDDLYVLTGPLYLPQLDVSGNWFVKYQVMVIRQTICTFALFQRYCSMTGCERRALLSRCLCFPQS